MTMSVYSVTSIASGATIGASLGILGRVLAGPWLQECAGALIFALGVWEIAAAIGLVGAPLIGSQRQTNPRWWRASSGWAAAWWGADLGSGVTTQTTHSVHWTFVLVLLWVGDPVIGAVVYAYWAALRAAPIWAGPGLAVPPGRLLRLRPPLRALGTVVSATAGAAALALLLR
jgi:hypothetical protein